MRNRKKEMVAMILAGGQGSRLKELTTRNAKPAVPFGGKYRIIDFALSNCSNSGIDTVGILTQYQPLVLNTHIGIGSPWDLDRRDGGVKILPPYMGIDGGRWYRGTANAIYENIHFIDAYDPEYILLLSGDHIYKMDYSKMLEFHKEVDSQLSIAVIEVPWDECHRFGILNTDDENKIVEFDEKPENPKSNLASMGIYIFNWKLLRQALIEDEADESSSNDFGKNIIPKLIDSGRNVFAYQFEGYWKDVGTVQSLWDANMDLLKMDNDLDLYDKSWRIYSVNPMSPPHFLGSNAIVESSLVNEGCKIEGKIYNSVISPDVHIGKHAIVRDSVILPNTVIEEYAEVNRAIVMSNTIVKSGTKVGNKDGEIVLYVDQTKDALSFE